MSDISPPAGATGAVPPPAAPVTDHRPVPSGVLPRGVQTWMMAGLAAGMLAVMLLAGRSDPPVRAGVSPLPAQAGSSAERVRDYQERLRALEAQALLETQAASAAPTVPPSASEGLQPAPPPDPIAADRKRREYESLFASNVAVSRRPEAQRADGSRHRTTGGPGDTNVHSPSIDDIADAVMRASARVGGPGSSPAALTPAAAPINVAATAGPSDAPGAPERTGPIGAAGPVHRVLEGTIIDAVLTNRLDGTAASPVNCLITNPLYSHSGRHVLIPAGARLLGETKPVQAFGETRLAVGFHRLLMPDGRTYGLDRFMGLQQIGDAGLKDRVNQHYLSTFGASAAVGLVSGLSQFLGSAGLAGGANDRTVVIAGGVGDATSQATVQVMNRFLNRLPTVTIREGHRVKVYLTSDLELPAYAPPLTPDQF